MILPTIHEVGIPHTECTKRKPNNLCAFTQKTVKRIPMMRKLGYPVKLYSCEGSDVEVDELIEVINRSDLKKAFGDKDFSQVEFEFDNADELHAKFYQNTSKALIKNLRKGDIIYCSWGMGHKPIIDEIIKEVNPDDYYIVEPGIGYPRSFAPYRVYESHARLNIDIGLLENARNVAEELNMPDIENHFEIRHYTDPRFKDAVIPVYFDPEEFEVTDNKSDYYLFIGRLTKSKGLEEAVNLADVMGKKLLVCGQGDFKENMGFDPPPHVEILGGVGIEERKVLLRDAELVICYTYFPEPGCNVHIEALASDTPIITSNRGIFPETVPQGVIGFRCQSFRQMVLAARHIHLIPRGVCRKWAMNNFSCDRVSLIYHYYHEHIRSLSEKGYWYYSKGDDISDLDWLVRPYAAEQLESYMAKVIESNSTKRLIETQVSNEVGDKIKGMIAKSDDPVQVIESLQTLLN